MKTTINTYGLTMTGITEAAAKNRSLHNRLYLQISYDKAEDRVHHTTHADSNNCTIWHDPNMITVCFAAHAMSAQEIADAIHSTLNL